MQSQVNRGERLGGALSQVNRGEWLEDAMSQVNRGEWLGDALSQVNRALRKALIFHHHIFASKYLIEPYYLNGRKTKQYKKSRTKTEKH